MDAAGTNSEDERALFFRRMIFLVMDRVSAAGPVTNGGWLEADLHDRKLSWRDRVENKC